MNPSDLPSFSALLHSPFQPTCVTEKPTSYSQSQISRGYRSLPSKQDPLPSIITSPHSTGLLTAPQEKARGPQRSLQHYLQ